MTEKAMAGRSMPVDRELARDWSAVMGRLRFTLGPRQLGYLKDSRPIEIEGQVLRVAVCSRFAVDWLPKVIGDEIRREVEGQWGRRLDVRFVPPVAAETPEALHAAAGIESGPAPFIGDLHPAHTFEKYLVTRGNRLAFEAAADIGGGEAHLPSLFVMGEPGLGKTHLLHALAWKARESGWPVVCLTWTDLVNRLTRSLREKQADDFKQQMRRARLLIVDDLRGAATAPWCADELLQAMDHVQARRGSVVVSGERPPKELGLPGRLVSRLEHGPVIPITPFDRDERINYALRYCQDGGHAIPAWAIDRVCAFDAGSVRTLRGALNTARLLVRAGTLDAGNLDLALANLTLREAAGALKASPAAIMETIASHFGVSAAALATSGRRGSLTQARAVAAAVLRERGLSVVEVGERLGRAKQTVSGIADRGAELLATDALLQARLREIEKTAAPAEEPGAAGGMVASHGRGGVTRQVWATG